jgi:hypothetical protein
LKTVRVFRGISSKKFEDIRQSLMTGFNGDKSSDAVTADFAEHISVKFERFSSF